MIRTFVIMLTLSALSLHSQESRHEIGISLGQLFEGEAYFWEADQYSGWGESMLLRAQYDFFFSRHWGVGAYYNFTSTEFFRYDVTVLHEWGFSFKGRFSAGEKLWIKPGVHVGFRSYSKIDGTGLGTNVSLAGQYQTSTRFHPYVETGFLAQPAGGNSDTDITYSPTWYITAGVAF